MAEHIGKYEIIEEVGRGAMGIVFKARDPVLGRLVALKTLTSESLTDPSLLQRFAREAQSAGSLQHPNIVTIFDLGEADGKPYIAMEFVEGESLQTIIARRVSMPLAQKVKIIVQFCQGLDHAHRHGVIHRDVKPGNILVRNDGVVKVVDFGIVHLESSSITRTGMFIGTVDYASPEQLTESRVDARSDLFSAGIVAYEFLAYHKPFQGSSITTTIQKILNVDPPAVNQLVPEVPSSLADVIMKCLRKDPMERFQSVGDLLLELDPLAQQLQREWIDEMVRQVPELVARKEFSRAREVLQSVLTVDSSDTRAKALMNEVNAEVKRLEAASSVRRFLADGELQMKHGEYAEAVRAFEEVLRFDPEHAPARELLDQARSELKRITQLREGLAAAQRAFKEGDLTQAEVELQTVMALDAENALATTLLGDIRRERTARERRFRLREALWQLQNLLDQKRYEEAVEHYGNLESEFPDQEEVERLLETARQKAEERRRTRDRFATIESLLKAEKFKEALNEAETVRYEFPNEAESTRLYEFAKTQYQSAESRELLKEQLTAIRELIASEAYDSAIEKGERLQREFPDDLDVGHLLALAVGKKRVAELERAAPEPRSTSEPPRQTAEPPLQPSVARVGQEQRIPDSLSATVVFGAGKGTLPRAEPVSPPIVQGNIEPSPVAGIATPVETTHGEETRPSSTALASNATVTTQAGASRERGRGKRLGWLLASAAAVVIATAVVYLARHRPVHPGPATVIPLEVQTSPSGARILIDDQDRGNAPVSLGLEPGTHQLKAVLDGYRPATHSVNVAAGSPRQVELTLQPLPTSLRIYTDFGTGQLMLDGTPAGELADGQFIKDDLGVGTHSLRLTAHGAETTLDFETPAASMPKLNGPVKARNLECFVIASQGAKALVESSLWKFEVSLDGKATQPAGPTGLELDNLTLGGHDLVVQGLGGEQLNRVIETGPAPSLTIILRSNRDVGTLIVVTREDGVHVFLDGKEQRHTTLRGQLRILDLKPKEYRVRVFKDGYQQEPERPAQIEKGKETLLAFTLRAIPQSASLIIQGSLPGVEVLLDQNPIGTTGPDGSFSARSVIPGEHTVELRKAGYKSAQIRRNFTAGKTEQLTGRDISLEAAPGILLVDIAPATTDVTIRRDGDSNASPTSGGRHELPPGPYTIIARWSGGREATQVVQVTAGEVSHVHLMLPRGGMEAWEDPSGWKAEGKWFVREGGGFVLFKPTPLIGRLVFTATLRKGSRLQWVLNYKSDADYALFEMDSKYFYRSRVINGKIERTEKIRYGLGENRACTVQIDVAPDSIIHQLDDGKKPTVDAWNKTKTDFSGGKFGFLIPKNDIVALSNFSFSPR
jgi:serine/threonine protein kinase